MNTTLQRSLFMRAIMVMLVMLVSATAGAQELKSWVLLSNDRKTLYFVRDDVDYSKLKEYKHIALKGEWRIPDHNDLPKAKTTGKKASWTSSAYRFCTKVVFEKSFSAAYPVYCYDWFKGFASLTTIEGIEYLNTDEVTTMSNMFYGCSALEYLDLSGFNTSKVTDMSGMFQGCSKLEYLNLDGFDTSSVTDMSHMFEKCRVPDALDWSKCDISKVENMSSMFKNCSTMTEFELSGLKATSLTDITSMFQGCSALETLDMSGFEAPNLKKINTLFKGCTALETLNMKGFNTGNVTSLSSYFSDKKSPLTTIDLSEMKALKVTNMSKMFLGCPSLKTVDLSKLDAPKVTDMNMMFYKCPSLETADLRDLDVPELTNMKNLFYQCSSLETANLSGINAPSLNSMANMFLDCKELTSLNLIGLNAPNVQTMVGMFQNCNALTALDLRDLYNTYKATDKKGKTTTKAVNTNSMFESCTNLVSILVDDLKWGKQETGGKRMFLGCSSLVGEDGTTIVQYGEKLLEKYGLMYAHTNIGGLLRKCDNIYLLTGNFVTFSLEGNQVYSATEGDFITVKVNIPEGNVLETVMATCGENGMALTYDDINDVYTFTMPKGAVTVTPIFDQIYKINGGEGITFSVKNEEATQAKAGEFVFYTLTIPAGKEVKEMTVMQDKTETSVEFIEFEGGEGRFTMPAGNVTVTVTYQDIPAIPTYTLTGEANMSFFVDGGKLEAEESEPIKVEAGKTVVVKVDEPEGQTVDVLTAKFGESSLEVHRNYEDDHYFTMPAGEVVVTATYVPTYPLKSGVEVDAESGERENDYVDFYNDKLNLIDEAFKGEKVWVDVDPDVIPANMYFTGTFTSTSEDVTIVPEVGEPKQYFIMPAHEVTVNAELVPQETLVLNLTTDTPVAIEGGEMPYLMMQWETYMTEVITVKKTSSDPYDYTYRYYDFDGDKTNDVVMIAKSPGGDVEPAFSMKREDGATSLGANYCMMLKSPGLPLKYRDVLFNFGKSETVTCIFLYDGLNNNNTLASYNGQTVNASFPDRALYKDGYWNTLCLPFDVTVEGSPLDGPGVTVKTLKDAKLENGTLTLKFTDNETELKAGVPYLIKWDKPNPYVAYDMYDPATEKTTTDLFAPTFKNVELKATLNPVVIPDLISFNGTYTWWTYQQDAPSVLLLNETNELFYPKNSAYLNCFRAYFQLLNGIEAIDPSLGGSIKNMVVDFGDEETTDIEAVDNGQLTDDSWYTLSGVKLNGKPSVPGVYLYNGRKVVIK